MNAHNEQQSLIAGLQDAATGNTTTVRMMALCAAAARALAPSVVKQNLTTQPAAAQEAVAHLPRRSIDWLHGLHSANDATRKADAYNRPVPDEQTIPVYAAPVTAAPARLVEAARDVIEAIRAIPEADLLALDDDPHPPSSLSVHADDLEAALASTPAVPGIDLAGKSGLLRRARSLFDQDREYALERGDSHHAGQCTKDIAGIDALIDASPNGISEPAAGTNKSHLLELAGDLTAGFMEADEQRELGRLLYDAALWEGNPLRALSPVGRAYPDSPKGGSAARAQRVTWLEVRGLAAGIVKKLNAFAEAKPKDWCGALDDSLYFAYLIEKEADKQAGDAEVQP